MLQGKTIRVRARAMCVKPLVSFSSSYRQVAIHLNPILDAPLTERGKEQAEALQLAIERESKKGMPMPKIRFCSSLSRSCQTEMLSWRSALGGRATALDVRECSQVPMLMTA